MRRLNGTELGALILAACFIIGGLYTVIHPVEFDMYFKAYKRFHAATEHVSETGARLYGILATVIGTGLIWFLFYGRPK